MKIAVFILLILIPTTVAYANPSVSPTAEAATVVVVIAALCLEIFLTMGVLIFSGLALGPTFLALVFGNIASYLGVLGPLAYHYELHLAFVEIAVVAAETLFIKLIALLGVFQQDTFTELRWRTAFIAAILGNASSYYIGTLMT